MFHGRIETWLSFKDAYRTLIHERSELSKTEKFQYLQCAITGTAKEALEGFTPPEDNYDAAWESLTKMYDDKRVLILRHASLLCNIGPINGSSEELRGLANQVRAQLKSLEALGRTSKDMLNDIVFSMMISNLDKETRKGWDLNITGTEPPTIEELMRFITKAAKDRDMNEIVPAWGPERETDQREAQHSGTIRRSSQERKDMNSLFRD
ncbi:hypothetical protein WN48_07586 [Eufriesea mexicana]|uniref:Uncharacterized protein n=1 Tax=Eufriesea mexicana TaxID=516756 RepID=A0A310SUY2_9HYME|nr:hypothetical protein WN48_07586 [Eufriesea mexicana]